ncbi:hypothetical protein QN354_10275 [Cryobacterium sp. 5I3]|nr:hypothetical protein [Cryobacterium sp. 5I3]MEB0202142.1 hypothetical protein [Cryobacterium sp. 5I3]
MIRLRVTSRAWIAAALVCASCLGLTSCVANDSTTEIRLFLAQKPGPEDALPSALKASSDGLDAASSRFVGTTRDVSYFVSKYTDPQRGTPGFCLMVAKLPDGPSNSFCGSADGMWTSGSGTGGARVIESNDEVPEGWTRLSDFLIVNPDAKP